MDIEARIQEQRTNEAIKNNYMGMEGKIYRIAKYLGFEIVKDSDTPDTLEYDALFEDVSIYTIPILDDNTTSYGIGYSYSGLNYGYNIEIIAHDFEQTLKLYFKGYLVYKEEAGSLATFVPHETWENIINELYKIVEEKIRKKIEDVKKEEEQAFDKLAQHEIQRLRSKWGDLI